MDNTELAKLVLKQVDTFPESFNMGIWGAHGSCGTVACLAGHVMLLSGYRLRSQQERLADMESPSYFGTYERPDGTIVEGWYGEEAARLLGMSRAERYAEGDIFLDMVRGLERFTELAGE